MAQEFGCNVDAVRATAQRLGTVVAEMDGFGNRVQDHQTAVASAKISSALDFFHKESSEFREKSRQSVDAMQKMLQGLVTGVEQVDHALRQSLPDLPAGQPDGQSAGGGGSW